MIHVDVNDLLMGREDPMGREDLMERVASVDSTADSTSDDQSAPETDADKLYEASLEGLEWFDLLVKALMQTAGVRDKVLFTLILSTQGENLDVPPSSSSEGGTDSAALRSKQQRVASAAGIPVPPTRVPLPSSFGPPSTAPGGSLLPQETMQPGGGAIDPGAFVVTPRSAMLAMAASSGQAIPTREWTCSVSIRSIGSRFFPPPSEPNTPSAMNDLRRSFCRF